MTLPPQFTGLQDWSSLGVDAQIVASVQDPAWLLVVPLLELLNRSVISAIRRIVRQNQLRYQRQQEHDDKRHS